MKTGTVGMSPITAITAMMLTIQPKNAMPRITTTTPGRCEVLDAISMWIFFRSRAGAARRNRSVARARAEHVIGETEYASQGRADADDGRHDARGERPVEGL